MDVVNGSHVEVMSVITKSCRSPEKKEANEKSFFITHDIFVKHTWYCDNELYIFSGADSNRGLAHDRAILQDNFVRSARSAVSNFSKHSYITCFTSLN